MNSQIQTINTTTGEIKLFDPEEAKREIAKAEALIEYASRIRDTSLLEQAIDGKVEQQKEFVEWWRDSVTTNKGGDRRSDQKRRSAFLVDDAEKTTGITQQQVARWNKALKDEQAYRARILAAAWKKVMAIPAGDHRIEYAQEDEWYTPSEYIEAARRVMGAIDLDPASSEEAQKTVQATHHFSREDSGLTQEWHGSVWMNPPYSQPLMNNFIEKAAQEVEAGRVTQAVVLTHNSTDTGWFHRMESVSSLLCFTRGRIAFVDPQGDRSSPTQGQCFFYVGENVALFREVFSGYGFIR